MTRPATSITESTHRAKPTRNGYARLIAPRTIAVEGAVHGDEVDGFARSAEAGGDEVAALVAVQAVLPSGEALLVLVAQDVCGRLVAVGQLGLHVGDPTGVVGNEGERPRTQQCTDARAQATSDAREPAPTPLLGLVLLPAAPPTTRG